MKSKTITTKESSIASKICFIIRNISISICLNKYRNLYSLSNKFKVDMPDSVEFTITPEQLAGFEFSERAISITDFTKRITV